MPRKQEKILHSGTSLAQLNDIAPHTFASPEHTKIVSPVELYSRERIWWEPHGWIFLNADSDALIALKSQNFTWKIVRIL